MNSKQVLGRFTKMSALNLKMFSLYFAISHFSFIVLNHIVIASSMINWTRLKIRFCIVKMLTNVGNILKYLVIHDLVEISYYCYEMESEI